MFSRILSAVICGLEGLPIQVEADVSEGLPGFSMVGDLSAKVREAQDRVTTAFRNSGIRLMPGRVTINLSPADVRKDGTGFDLPIAIAVLEAYRMLPREVGKDVMILGELSLNGAVRGIRGVLPMVQSAKRMGCKACILPEENRMEGELVPGIQIIGVKSLEEVMEYFKHGSSPAREKREVLYIEETEIPDFSCIQGQSVLRRAAEIAVSGRHNFLMVGSPGAGKSLIARCMPGILPPLSREESLEVSAVYSVAGLLPEKHPLIVTRPFRAPHHTITPQALAGGGRIPRPGELSLAHRGVLFLDELPEFKRETLEVLRQPMEEKKVWIARLHGNYAFPADTMIVAAMNPCKCGFFPDMKKCICTEQEVRHYLKRVSRPLLDRMDISVEAARIAYRDLASERKNESSAEIRSRVQQISELQKERYRGSGFRFNADLTPDGIRRYCFVEPRARRILEKAYGKMELTARAYHRILKVARTIADMDGKEQIGEEHICEAIGYRFFWKE